MHSRRGRLVQRRRRETHNAFEALRLVAVVKLQSSLLPLHSACHQHKGTYQGHTRGWQERCWFP